MRAVQLPNKPLHRTGLRPAAASAQPLGRRAAHSTIKYTLRRATESDYDVCYGVTRENMYELFCRHWGGWVDAEFKKGLDLNGTRVILVWSTSTAFGRP